MWKSFVLLLCLSGYCLAGPVGSKRNMPIVQQREDATAAAASMESLDESESAPMAEPEITIMSTLTLPSNATSIRADITDGFSCENKTYGYYADVDNDCQIFHVCLPVTYADGKENTFRWSFICPEETIFSQDSFTCMRPDDMTITCDESILYYELNRNFGMVDSEKEDNEMTAETENKEPSEVVMEAETEPASIKPMVQEEEEEKEAPKPVQQAVKVQKPNRRKPGVTYASQKKPNKSYPLRKIPQVQPAMPEIALNQGSEDTNEAEKPAQVEEEVKPMVQKFSRRPVAAISNTFNDKIQSSKPESMTGIRTQLFNQNRKRPSMFNKKPVEQQQQEEQVKPDVEPIILEIQPEQQMFSHMESEMSNTNIETQVADSKIQASETNQVFVKPEEAPKEDEATMTEDESNKVEQDPFKESQQVLEAFEEIPAVIAEVMETQSATAAEETEEEEQMPVRNTEEAQTVEETQTAEETPVAEESQDVEKSHTAEESQIAEEPQEGEEESPKTEQLQTAEESQVSEESQIPEEIPVAEETKSVEEVQSVEETQANEEIPEVQVSEKIEEPQAAEETPYVEEFKPVEAVLAVEEPQPIEAIVTMEDIQTPEVSEIVKETPAVEEAKPEQPEQFPASEEIEQIQTETVAEPAIFENSEEGLVSAPSQTIEEMENEKPADAPESIQATEEMSHPDATVQQMIDDMEENKQTIGGFKPVDPIMAHEAEQLIADFINTLRNNDFTNETPGMMMQQHNNDEAEQEQEQVKESIVVQHESDKIESNEVTKQEVSDVSDKAGEVEETVKSNESEEVIEENVETQPEVVEPQAMSQENNPGEMENVKVEAEESKTETETMDEENTDNQESIALKSLEAQSSENVEEPQKSKDQLAESSNMMLFNNMPQEMYQIPVQVITTPLEEIPATQQETQAESEGKPIEMSVSSKDKLEEETPAVMMGAYKPLSIDDIVELVKERLDHMPKDEMETPMQLEQVLGDMHEDKATEEKVETQVEVESEPAQSEEDIVMPIYQRTVQPVKTVEAGVQTEAQEQDLTVEQSDASDAATEVKEKSNRSYRSRSMLKPKLDPRKRRFLFKSDKFKSS